MTHMPAVIRPAAQSPEVALAIRVYGNSVRLEIVVALRRGSCRRAELVDRTRLTAEAVTAQLRELQALGLVHGEVLPGQGRPMLYSLNHSRADDLLHALTTYASGKASA